MKGFFSAGLLAFVVETKKETWCQGEKVDGVLQLKNKGQDKIPLDQIDLSLTLGQLRKVHGKKDGSMSEVARVKFEEGKVLLPGEEFTHSFTFELAPNCPITDKRKSLYLLYGQGDAESHLQLTVGPRPLFGKIVEYVERFFRFRLKETKGVKDGVCYKFAASLAKEFANVESLELTMALDGTILLLDFFFVVKKIDVNSVVNQLIKGEIEHSVRLLRPDYSWGEDMLNHDKVLAVLEEAIGKVRMKVFK